MGALTIPKKALAVRRKIVDAEKRRHESRVAHAKEVLKRKKEDEKIAKARKYALWGKPVKKKKQGKTLSRKSRIRII